MAWNGRNESILGAKAAADSAPAPGPPRDVDTSTKSSGEKSEPKKAVAPPAPSVWNGRHAKIIGVNSSSSQPKAKEQASVVTTQVSLENVPMRSPSPAISLSTASSISNKKELVVSSPPKEDSKVLVKEDETTNSTAGSSTTNITIDSEPPRLEGNVVTTTVPSESEKKKDKNNKDTSSDNEKKKKDKSAGGAPATIRSTNNRQNQQQGKNSSNGGANNGRRSGNNNNKGGNRGNNQQGKSNSFTRGNSTGGTGRRRDAIHNPGKPLCTFYVKGMCNRGTSCAFQHDPAQLSKSNAAFSRSNSHPPVAGNSRPAAFPPAKRAFDPHKARAIQLAKEAQDKEDRSRFMSTSKIISDEKKEDEDAAVAEDQPFFSIDVECIATGYGSCAKGINDGCGNEGRKKEGVPANQYNDRSHRYPGRVAMVDSEGNVLADVVIRPPNDGAGVISYLTPLTGLTKEMCLGDDAKSLEEAVAVIKGLLPKNGILVGQAIDHDVEWLGLTSGGVDFDRMVDISEIFRQRMPSSLNAASEALKKRESGEEPAPSSDDQSSDEYLGFATRYRHFSLRHVCLNLLGEDIQSGVHDPVTDARYSLTLFRKYRDSSVTQLRIVRDGLHRAPITPGFAAENAPVIDGVCVSAAGYPYKRAARKILRWYLTRKQEQRS